MAEDKKERPRFEVMAVQAKEAFVQVADEMTWNREIVFALQAIRGNELLQKCDPESIKNAVVNIALTGATLNPALQQAFLIPRKMKCCLDFSYRGLIKIAVDSDSVYDIEAVAVFEGDEFHFEMGINPVLIHIPKMFDDDKDKKVVAVYAIATLHHHIKKFVVLDKEKIARARKSAQYDKVWAAHPDEMAKKTAIKLLYKQLPPTERMSTAVSVINEHEGLVAKDEAKAKDVMKRFDLGKKEDDQSEDMIECPKGSSVTKSICYECKDKNAECPTESV
jgi:recombination protein RecT